jgi:hypothetical protein
MQNVKIALSLKERFKRFVSSVTLIAFTVTGVLAPTWSHAGTTIVIAPPSGLVSTWATWSQNPNNWVSMPNSRGYGENVSWPKSLNYTTIATSQWIPDRTDPNQAAFSWKMIEGERWITNGREELGQSGVPSNQISSRINSMPKTAAYVFANYSPENAELIIEVQKVEKSPNGQLVVSRADYTPHHGEFNRWKRDYLTPLEDADASKLGYNPFQKFRGANNDPVFHNISWEAAGVAIGMAMRYSDAHIAYIASDKSRMTSRVVKSGGLLKKKITTYVDGFVKPQWFVATPMEVQPEGGMSSICVKSIGASTSFGNTSGCDSKYHLASSGVSIASWTGGNMPELEQNVYSYVNQKSSFTVLAFTILTFALTWGVASFATMGIGMAGQASISALQAASIGAGVYAGVAGLSGAGLTTAQSGWAGNTGDGALVPDTANMGEHQIRLNQGIRNKQILSREGTGLDSVKQLYAGNCPENWTNAQCVANGLDGGSMHRPDSYRESNVVIELRDAETRCKATGLTGRALAICTAPARGVWTIQTGL